MRILEVKNWKKVALDRDEWAKLLKKARAHRGCRADDDDDIELKHVTQLNANWNSNGTWQMTGQIKIMILCRIS